MKARANILPMFNATTVLQMKVLKNFFSKSKSQERQITKLIDPSLMEINTVGSNMLQ